MGETKCAMGDAGFGVQVSGFRYRGYAAPEAIGFRVLAAQLY